MMTASALHILTLGACFVVQFGAPEVSRIPGVRRAVQTMESAGEAPSSQADKAAVVRFRCLVSDDFSFNGLIHEAREAHRRRDLLVESRSGTANGSANAGW
jgi:hypothetical protein